MRMPEPTIEVRAQEAYLTAYQNALGGLNRAERRTAAGRRVQAQAEIAALKAENDVLRDHIKELTHG